MAAKSAKDATPLTLTSDADTTTLMSVADVARRLNVSASTVHRMRDELRYVMVRRQVMIRADVFERWIERNTRGAG